MLGGLLGIITCWLVPLSIFIFGAFLAVAMMLLGMVYAAIDAHRLNSGAPPVTLRDLFVRGLGEAALALALTVGFELAAGRL